MPIEAEEQLSRIRIPDAYIGCTACDDAPAIRRESDVLGVGLMPSQSVQYPPRPDLRDPRDHAVTHRDTTFEIGAEGNLGNRLGSPEERGILPIHFGLPYFCRPIHAACNEMLTVGRERDGSDHIAMALTGAKHSARFTIPNPGCMISAARGKAFAIGREGNGADSVRMPA